MHECTTVERHKRIKEKRQYTTHSSCSCTVLRSTCRVVHRYTYSCVNKIMIIDILKRCILYMNYDHRSSRTATNQHPTTSAWYMPHIVLGDRSQVKPENNPTENSRSICDGPISVPLYSSCITRRGPCRCRQERVPAARRPSASPPHRFAHAHWVQPPPTPNDLLRSTGSAVVATIYAAAMAAARITHSWSEGAQMSSPFSSSIWYGATLPWAMSSSRYRSCTTWPLTQ